MNPILFLAEFPPPSADAIHSALGLLLLVLGILGAAFWTWNQGKQAIGKESPQELKQPVEIRQALECAFIQDCINRHLPIEQRVERLEEGHAASTARIERQLEQIVTNGEERKDTIMAKLSFDSQNIHNRIDGLAEKQGQLIGEIKHVAQLSRDAAAAAQQAAISAARGT